MHVCTRSMLEKYGGETKTIVLVIKNFLPADLQREFNCTAKNKKGLSTRRAHLTEEGKRQDFDCKTVPVSLFFFLLLFSFPDLVLCFVARLPWVELCFGLGATVLLTLLLFLMYHFFWIELLLLYRSWFGTNEQLLGKSHPLNTPRTGRVEVHASLWNFYLFDFWCVCVCLSVCV